MGSSVRIALAIGIAGVAIGIVMVGRHREAIEGGMECPLRITGLAIGEVWINDRYVHAIEVYNDGQTEIDIEDIVTSCTCVSLTPRKFRIAPGGSQTISLELNLLAGPRDVPTAATRTISVGLLPVLTEGYRQPLPYRLHGTVKSPFALSRPEAKPASPVIRGSGAYHRTFTIYAWEELVSPNVTSDCAIAVAEMTPLAPSGELWPYEVTLNVDPEVENGVYEVPVRLTASKEEGRVIATDVVYVSVEVADDVRCAPSVIVAGAMQLNSSFEVDVLLYSQNDAEFRIVNVDAAGEIEVRSLSIPNTYRIAGLASNVGVNDYTVRFHVRESTARTYPVTLSVSSIGLSAE